MALLVGVVVPFSNYSRFGKACLMTFQLALNPASSENSDGYHHRSAAASIIAVTQKLELINHASYLG